MGAIPFLIAKRVACYAVVRQKNGFVEEGLIACHLVDLVYEVEVFTTRPIERRGSRELSQYGKEVRILVVIPLIVIDLVQSNCDGEAANRHSGVARASLLNASRSSSVPQG